eukprot:Phypoly_transcript_02169.p1 GENE.Phypoly_transcript_02169~~Phypoly_transcript_02169.p1  ORF type:complete len:926 (+),score=218.46 Phypoly_transcript_02169:32-2809(+)
MHSVRARYTRLVAHTTRGVVWKRSYASETENDEFITRPSEKYNLLKIYNQTPQEHVKHPKIPVPIKPFSAKHTPETDPWLFMLGVFPKSVQELTKEAEEKKLAPPGSTFHGVWLKDADVEQAKRDRFAKELITFRNNYEKPIIDAFKEVDSQIEEEYTRQRFEKRKLTRAARKKAQKKPQPGSTLLRFMQEKEYWEKFIDVLHVGDFGDLPPKRELFELLEFETLKYDIGEPEYDTDVIKHDYGQKSDWSISQHLTLMIPDDEVPDLQIDKLFPPETMDQLYRHIKELEYVYGPVQSKLDAFMKYQELVVQKDKEEYLITKGKEIPPSVHEIFNPAHITEFDDVEDPDSISVEEIGYRLDRAYNNWKQRLLDPEVENRVKNYVKGILGGGVWSRFTMGGNNRILQFADSSIADRRIFLKDADVVRVLKGQLVDAGLARVAVKRKTEEQIKKEQELKQAQDREEEAIKAQLEGNKEETPSKITTTDTMVEYEMGGRKMSVKKSPILTDDLNTYLEFEPVYKDLGTISVPSKPKKEKTVSKESEEEQFNEEVWKLDDRSKGPSHLSKRLLHKYKPLFKKELDYENMDSSQIQELMESQEEQLEAYREYEKLRAIWPQPQVGEDDLEGARLEEFMKTKRWYPVNHLYYNNNVEFFTRTLPLAPELTRADKMRMRKVVMRVYIPPLELPPVVEKRLKLLLGPRYDHARKVVTLTGSDRHTQKDNKAYLKLLFREVLHEAWLADPNYIPTRAPAIEAPRTWKPSEAAANVTKPVLFRLYGTPLQDTELQQKIVKDLNTVLSNPAGLIPNHETSRKDSFLQLTTPPPKIEQDPALVEYNRRKQRREKAVKRIREPKYNYAPSEFYTQEKVDKDLSPEKREARRAEEALRAQNELVKQAQAQAQAQAQQQAQKAAPAQQAQQTKGKPKGKGK